MQRMSKVFWPSIFVLVLILWLCQIPASVSAQTSAEVSTGSGADEETGFQNEPPQLTCPRDDSVHIRDTFKSTVFSVIDPDGDAVTVEFLDIVPSAPVNPSIVRTHVEWWTATTKAGDYLIRLQATDSHGLKDTCEFMVTVWNRPAQITCPPDDSVQAGQTFVSEDASVFDPDGDPVTIRILRIDPKPTYQPVLVDKHVEWVTTPAEKGDYVITLLAVEFCNPVDTCEFTVTVLPDGPGDLTCPQDDSVHATVPSVTFISTDFSITGPGTDPSDVTLFRVDPAPVNMPFITGSHVEWLTDCDDAGKTFSIWLEAPVGGGVHDTCYFEVKVYNQPPELICPENAMVYAGDTLISTDFSVTDPDGDSAPVTFLYIDPPATNDPSVVGNHVEWITTANEADREFDIYLVAKDPCGLADTCKFTVTVVSVPTNDLTCPEDDSVHATVPAVTFVSTNFSVTGPGADPSRVRVISIDPSPAAGMPHRVESHIEWLTDCDDAGKTFTICLEATFDVEPKDTCCFEVVVYNRPPVLTCPDYGHIAPNKTFASTDFSVFDPDEDPVDVTLVSIRPTPTYQPVIVDSHVEWRTKCSDAGKDYIIQLVATDPCGLADTCEFTVSVSYSPAPDFYIWVFPVAQNVTAGQTADYLVELYSLYGFTEPCSLFITGLPTPPNSGFFDQVVLTPTGHTKLRVQTTAQTPSGTYTLTFTAKQIGGAVQHAVQLRLDVDARADDSVLAGKSAETLDDPDTALDPGFQNEPPQLRCPDDASVHAEKTLKSAPFSATDPNGDAVTVEFLDIHPPAPADPSIVETHVEWRTVGCHAGDYLIRLVAVDAHGLKDTSEFTVGVLSGPPPDFSIWAAPDTQYVTGGEAVSYEVGVTSLFGYAEPCTLTVSGLPSPPDSGVFDQVVLTPDETTTLHVYTSTETDTGWYTLVITARGASRAKALILEDSTEVYLKVEESTAVWEQNDSPGLREGFALLQNQPNPFNPETRLSYYLPRPSQVKLTIYNVLGRRVKTLFYGYQRAGMQTVTWDGRDDYGLALSSGIYFYRLQADAFCETKKMTLTK